MKRLVRLLGSLELTLVLMLLVSIWFALGGTLSVSSQYGNTIRALNDQLVGNSLFVLKHLSDPIWSAMFNLDAIRRQQLSGLPSPDSIVRGWLWGAFILAFLLGVNLVFGTKDWVVDLIKRRMDLRKFLLLAMHALFGIVLAGHLVSSVAGFKEVGGLPVKEGERIEFLGRYSLRVDKIRIESEGDHLLNRKGEKTWMTPDRFLKQPLYVCFTLFDGGNPIFSGRVTTFEPVQYKRFRITLLPFSFRSQVSNDFMGRGVGPQITISSNPGIPVMMIFQPLWILVLLVYTVTTFWSPRDN